MCSQNVSIHLEINVTNVSFEMESKNWACSLRLAPGSKGSNLSQLGGRFPTNRLPSHEIKRLPSRELKLPSHQLVFLCVACYQQDGHQAMMWLCHPITAIRILDVRGICPHIALFAYMYTYLYIFFDAPVWLEYDYVLANWNNFVFLSPYPRKDRFQWHGRGQGIYNALM